MAAKLRAFGPILSMILLSSPIPPARAADQTIILNLGTGSMLLLARPCDTVLMADPDIVDVRTQSDRSVVLQPLNPGATNIIFLDESSIAIVNVRILVYPDHPV